MKNTIKILLAIFISFSLASCRKEIPTKISASFYTPDEFSGEAPLSLYMDGTNMGTLPTIKTSKDMPLSSKDPKLATALKMDIMSGAHIFQAKKKDGTVFASSQMSFKFYKNKTECRTQSSVGGAGSSLEPGNVVVIWLSQ